MKNVNVKNQKGMSIEGPQTRQPVFRLLEFQGARAKR